MRMIFFFYEMFVVHVPIKFILITSADVGNTEFQDNVCDMECVFFCVRYNCSAQGY